MSAPKQPINKEALAQLMEAYLLDALTDEQIDAFEASLLRHPEAAECCAEAIQTTAMTREVFRDKQEQHAALGRDLSPQEFRDLLAELGEAEDRAEAQLVHFVGHLETRRPIWQQWQFVIPTAMAALVAIAIIVIVTVPTGTSPRFTINTAIESNDPNKPAESAQSTPHGSAVATLTATHNAQWDSQPTEDPQPAEDLRRGSKLHPNQRLTLTAGFANITTAQGAEILLQAPCSIEMTGGDNALRLVRGELAARVDTDRAKGFTVFLPQNSRIVDLGTAFRVAVDASGQADCLVTEGKVLWQPDGQDDASALIVAGQTAQLVDGRPIVSDVVEVFSEDFDGYTAADEHFYADGQLDTGLRVAHTGSLWGWSHTGFNSIHAVDRANRAGSNAYTPDYAAMVIYGQLQTAINGANEAGQQYEVSYLAGPAIFKEYKEGNTGTTAEDRLLIELVRRDGTVLASHTHRPGAWQGQMTLYPDRFTYRGDGSGELTLRISSADAGLHDITSKTVAMKYDSPRFAGAIDDLSIRVIDASSNSTTDRGNEQP